MYILALVLASSGCAVIPKKIAGTYKSSCLLYNTPDLIMSLNEDRTFNYRLAFLEDTIKGKWHISGDTLILNSISFLDEFIQKTYPDAPKELIPRYKYTESHEKDVFLIKGSMLLPLTKEGFNKKCYLKKR